MRRDEKALGTASSEGSTRIGAAFRAASADGRAAFIPYVVAGYPDAPTSERAALAAIDAGADIIELGLPYSDPLADGATIQRAGSVALAGGNTLDASMALLERVAAARPGTPLLAMGYANQFLGARGAALIAGHIAAAGASGAIVADLTPDEGAPVEVAFRDRGLALVYLVAPTTPTDRAAAIAARSGGFLYCVSLLGTTGARTSLPAGVRTVVGRMRAVSQLPLAVGFGVTSPAHVRALVRSGADGVVVGSALVDALGPDGRDVDRLATLAAQLRAATARPANRPPLHAVAVGRAG